MREDANDGFGEGAAAGARVRRSLLISACDRYAVVALNLAGTALLARLLTPEEVGVFVVGASLVMLADIFRDFGIGTYLVQAPEVTPAGVRTAFTMMLLLAVLLAALVWLAAGPAAAAFGEARLAPVLGLVASGILLSPFNGPSLAILRREMAFGRLAAVNVAAACANLAVSAGLAVAGAGYLSPAWGLLAGAATTTLLAVLWRPAYPVFGIGLAEWRRVLGFGGRASGAVLLNALYAQLPQLALGRLAGFDAAGLYSRAALLCQVPERLVLSACLPVVLPAFAAEARAGGSLRESYLRGLALVSALTWPFLLCLALMADPAVRLALGPQWEAAAPAVRIMALASLAAFPSALTYPVLVATGRVGDALVSSLLTLPPSAALVCLAASAGVEATAAVMVVAVPLQVAVALVLIRRRVGFAWGEIPGAVWRSAVLALAAAAPPALAAAWAGPRLDLPLPVLGAVVLASGLAWAAAAAATRHPVAGEARALLALVPASARARPVLALLRTRFGAARRRALAFKEQPHA